MELLLFVAIFPVVLIYSFVYVHDVHDVEPIKHLVISFLLGVLILFPVALIEATASGLLGVNESSSFFGLAIYTILIIGFTEEAAKYLILTRYCSKLPEFSEPFDGIVYGVSASLGFAAIENVLYSLQYGINTAIGRAFTSVPAHAMFGMILGYWAGRAFQMKDPAAKRRCRLYGLTIATLCHGIFDFFVMSAIPYGVALGIGTLPLVAYYCVKAFREHHGLKFTSSFLPDLQREQDTFIQYERGTSRTLAQLALHLSAGSFACFLLYGVLHAYIGGHHALQVFQQERVIYGALLTSILVLEACAFGLRKGSSIAWYFSLLFFLLLLPTFFFPVSILGIYGLFHPQTQRQEHE